MNRRGFLQILGASPLAGRAAAKAVVEQAAANLSGIRGLDTLSNAAPAPSGLNGPDEVPREKVALLLRNAATRDMIKGFLFEQNRRIYAIDPDIAVHRSTSLAAKIVYQRQRVVEQELEHMAKGYFWERLQTVLRAALKMVPWQ